MSVYLDKQRKTYYYDFKHNGKHYKKRGFRLKSEAADAERLALLSLDKEPSKTLTVKQLVNLFLEDYKTKADIDNYNQYRQRLNLFVIGYFGDTKIKALTPLKMNAWRKHLSEMTYSKSGETKKYSVSVLNATINLLSTVFKFGNKYYEVSKNPTLFVDRFKKDKTLIEDNIQIWDEKQFARFIDHVEDDVCVAFFTLIFWTGIRKGEARALRWKDINLKKGTLTITKTLSRKTKGRTHEDKTPKTQGSFRTVTVDSTTLKLIGKLKEYYSHFQDFSEEWYVFGGNSPIVNRTIDRVKEKAIKEAELPFIRLHDFRHSHASWLLWNGFNISYISKRLGHTDISMTLDTYSHIIDSLASESDNKLNKLRGGILGEKSKKTMKLQK